MTPPSHTLIPDSVIQILFSFYQICSQVEAVYDLQLPPTVAELLRLMRSIITLSLNGLPSACFGAAKYIHLLQFWIVLPFGLTACSILLSFFTRVIHRKQLRLSKVLMNAATVALRTLFVCYPIVSTLAHKVKTQRSQPNPRGTQIAPSV